MYSNMLNLVEPAVTVDEMDIDDVYKRKIQVWILRILTNLKGYRKVGFRFNIDADSLLRILQLELAPDEEPEDAFIPARLSARLQELEPVEEDTLCTFSRNLEGITEELGLTIAEKSILEFLLIVQKHTELGETTDLIGEALTLGEASQALGTVLQLPVECIRSALHANAALISSGLLQLDSRVITLRNKIQIFSRMLDAMSMPQKRMLGVLSCFVDHAPAPELSRDDFVDYEEEFSLLSCYLLSTLNKRTTGSNVLIHGLPGVGKTQLVRTLCHDLKVALFEIETEDLAGNSLSASSRLAGLQLSQKLLARRNETVLLFDEIEDVFPQADFPWMHDHQIDSSRKGWMNKQLETNPIPAFWLANSVSQIDAAYLRRFDIVLEVRPMTPKSRRRLIEKHCREAEIKTGPWVTKAAENSNLSPALIANFTRVMAQTHPKGAEVEAQQFEKLVNGTFNAMGLPEIRLGGRNEELPYKVDFLNADSDLNALIEGLSRNKEGRLLCYGPPGTGKTAFARHVSEMLELPLLQFKASDILGSYVGMTEINLAQAFRQARDQGALMLLDEIDSLLRSRDNAKHSWEVTQVNELLVQMESFTGILIACTNHKSTLDGAAARRFDIKISLGYMRAVHKWNLFQATVSQYDSKFKRVKRDVKNRLKELDYLTPGDFKTAVRKLSLSGGSVTESNLLNALEEEVRAKEIVTSRGIGFSAAI